MSEENSIDTKLAGLLSINPTWQLLKQVEAAGGKELAVEVAGLLSIISEGNTPHILPIVYFGAETYGRLYCTEEML